MSLIVLTGGVRSGKSAAAESLAARRGTPVVAAVCGWDGDAEMQRRIAAHVSARPAEWTTVAAPMTPERIAAVPFDVVLLLDCLGSLIAHACVDVVGADAIASRDAETEVSRRCSALVGALLGRTGDTIVVTNEVGSGVVPEWASARVFRDEVGRANRRLVDAADGAYLVVAGRCIDLKALPGAVDWACDLNGDS